METEITGQVVPIADRAFVWWSAQAKDERTVFLKGLEPEFFVLSARHFAQIKEGREEMQAAMHIRVTRDHAAEMLFSLIAAAIQCPLGVPLWVAKYRTEQLDAILDGFERGAPINTTNGKQQFDWTAVARRISVFAESEETWRETFVNRYSQFWRRLALQFTDREARTEYNAIKHGLRLGIGGATISFTREISPGVVDPNAKPTVISGSAFGGSVWVPEEIEGRPRQYSLRHKNRNWTPSSLLLQIELIASSIKVVIAFLKACNGEAPGTVSMSEDASHFDQCWKNQGTLLSSQFGISISPEGIPVLTEEQMLAGLEGPQNALSEAHGTATPPTSPSRTDSDKGR